MTPEQRRVFAGRAQVGMGTDGVFSDPSGSLLGFESLLFGFSWDFLTLEFPDVAVVQHQAWC